MRVNVFKKSLFPIILFILAGMVSAQAGTLPKQGPKVRLAVSQFGATDKFAAAYGGWNIGGGLAAQLVTALIQSERAVVVERAILSKVLIEQELGQNRLSSPFTQTPAGQLLGVDYLIVGEVTEFEEKEMGGGAQASLMKWFGPEVSGDVNAAEVGIDLRVIDTRTGEILHSHRAQGRAWEKSMSTKIDYRFIQFGGDAFHKTPLGQATRHAIDDALQFILSVVEKRTSEFSWLARIIEVEGNDVYLDAGQLANIHPGDQFHITSVRKVLTAPETNEILGLIEDPVADAQAVDVEPKYTRAKVLGGPGRPHIGDVVRFAVENKPIESPSQTSLTGYQVME